MKIVKEINSEMIGEALHEAEYTYSVVAERIYTDELGEYETYGLSVSCGDFEVARISDLSVDRAQVERLSKLCNEKELDPIHLFEIAEDFLADTEIA